MPCNNKKSAMHPEKFAAWVLLGSVFYAAASVTTVLYFADRLGLSEEQSSQQTAQAEFIKTPRPL